MQRQKMRHLRVIQNGKISNRGGATISGIVDDNGKVVRYAVAWCHNKDNFNRHHGRVTATGRMNSANAITMYSGTWDDLVASVQCEVNSVAMMHTMAMRQKMIDKAEKLMRKAKAMEVYL